MENLKSPSTKAELLQEGIFFLLQIFARDVLVMKKLEIEKTKPTSILLTFKTNIIKVGLVFSIFNLGVRKKYLLARIWLYQTPNVRGTCLISARCAELL